MKDSKTKKSTTKKVSTGKKTTSAKKSTKSSAPKKRVVSKISKEKLNINDEIKIDEKITTKEQESHKDLLLRVVLVIAYAMIILILVIGFIEPHINNIKVESSYKPAYLVEEEILSKGHILTLDNAKEVLGKLNGDYFVYIGYTKMYNSDVQVLDMGIANLLNSYDLKNKFYYINIDSIIKRNNRVAIVNNSLGYHDVLITKVPTILYVNSENIIRVENIITRDDDKLMTIGDFQKLLDINQFVVKK